MPRIASDKVKLHHNGQIYEDQLSFLMDFDAILEQRPKGPSPWQPPSMHNSARDEWGKIFPSA